MHQNESIKINFCNFSVSKLHFYALEFTVKFNVEFTVKLAQEDCKFASNIGN